MPGATFEDWIAGYNLHGRFSGYRQVVELRRQNRLSGSKNKYLTRCLIRSQANTFVSSQTLFED
jgi:hypothetical protein